jgi:pimeloyl-ACP methyl ester carboxylesterase
MSYYEMKNRGGVVGQKGLGPLIASITAGKQVRVHLMGHSFGARLVSYALTGLPDSALGAASPIKSLTLVQGAFSHFAFADPTPSRAVKRGSLSAMRNRVDGPLVCTFSAADRAVGWWYPNASMLAHQNSQSMADLVYQWGGMGHDGFQQASPAATSLKLRGTTYPFAKDGIYLLDANDVIKKKLSSFSGAHSDIVHDEVVSALVSAAAVARA